LAPHEPGYDFRSVNIALQNAAVNLPRGAFVDLNYIIHAQNLSDALAFASFDELADWPKPPLNDANNALGYFVSYDTWSLLLERDGIDQNPRPPGDPVAIDEGFDGVDNPDIADNVARNGVDDYNERETRPPYNVPLTGIEVKIRTIEFGTRQVRQVSVVGDFSD
jgi:hypothetical protein